MPSFDELTEAWKQTREAPELSDEKDVNRMPEHKQA